MFKKSQAAILLKSGSFIQKPRLYDFFAAGKYTLSRDNLPLYLADRRNHVSENGIDGSIIFCSLNAFCFSKQIYTGYSLGQTGMGLEAIAKCSIRVSDAKLLFRSVVAGHRIFSTRKLLKLFGKALSKELLRRDDIYSPNHPDMATFDSKLEGLGIEVLSLEFDSYKAEGYGTLT